MSLKGTPMMLKFVNLGKIDEFIRINEFATKPQIAAETNISLVTVTKLVNSLVEDGKIIPCGIDESTGGRHAQRYRINPDAHYSVGIYYVKGTFIGVVADAVGKIVLQRKFPADAKGAQSLLRQTCDAIDMLMQLYSGGKAAAIGIGIPGVENEGILNSIPSLPAWEGFPLAAELESRYGIPVLLENDINLAAIGLYASQYEASVHDMMLIYLDEGVGSGIILNGALFRGKTNFAGELGYLPIDMPKAAKGMLLPSESLSPKRERLEIAIAQIREKIETGECGAEMQKILCNVLAQAVISVVSVLNPEVIIIKSVLLKKEAAARIKELVSDTVGIANTPEIVLISDIEACCLGGVVKMCMDHTDFSLRLSSNNGSLVIG